MILRRKRLEDGTFGELEKVFDGETPEEKSERLESDNAFLMYDSMMKDVTICEMTAAQAEILYILMTREVI